MMNGHPYAGARFAHALSNLKKVIPAIQTGDLQTFIAVVENEALSLHAMMMASNPGFILFGANTLGIVQKIVKFRGQTGVNLCFTLDAGPNVHVLYPEKDHDAARDFIKNELLQYCTDNTLIEDRMGNGPQRIW
jgi:diphosphomevalonate decarboxylase